jgi:hypothetical protein
MSRDGLTMEERLAQRGTKADSSEASARAYDMGNDPKVKAWMRRFRRLMKDQPPETWIYWQEDTMCLIALSPEGRRYVNPRDTDGSDTAAVIDSQMVKGSDAGAW